MLLAGLGYPVDLLLGSIVALYLLTNAARHGSGHARISIAFADTGIDITVTNPVPAGGTPRSGGGHGLIGMRERATLLGGHLDTERVNGTFRVRARIPYGSLRT